MSGTYDRIKLLVQADRIQVSQHAFRRLAEHGINSDDLVQSIHQSQLLENYLHYHAGPAVLVLHFHIVGAPLHAVWGIEKGTSEPAVLVTAYRPDPLLWTGDFKTRLS